MEITEEFEKGVEGLLNKAITEDDVVDIADKLLSGATKTFKRLVMAAPNEMEIVKVGLATTRTCIIIKTAVQKRMEVVRAYNN